MTTDNYSDDTFAKFGVDTSAERQLTCGSSLFTLRSWRGGSMALGADATHFGFVHSGIAKLKGGSGEFALQRGMYFSLPGKGVIEGDGLGFVISQTGYQGLFQFGGPIESRGRLEYIDGCSDTLLLSPVVMGDACLNLLVIPPGTAQTAHTHPSFRAGVIVAGSGHCQLRQTKVDLVPGDLFVIEPEGLHSFHTASDSLTVIAFHPDSDFGPHRDDHPMVNRTIVDGTSAAQLTPAERRIGEYAP